MRNVDGYPRYHARAPVDIGWRGGAHEVSRRKRQ